MNEIKTNARKGSNTRRVDSIHSVRKPACPASFDEQLLDQPVMAV
jgi:hypothetical protein